MTPIRHFLSGFAPQAPPSLTAGIPVKKLPQIRMAHPFDWCIKGFARTKKPGRTVEPLLGICHEGTRPDAGTAKLRKQLRRG